MQFYHIRFLISFTFLFHARFVFIFTSDRNSRQNGVRQRNFDSELYRCLIEFLFQLMYAVGPSLIHGVTRNDFRQHNKPVIKIYGLKSHDSENAVFKKTFQILYVSTDRRPNEAIFSYFGVIFHCLQSYELRIAF